MCDKWAAAFPAPGDGNEIGRAGELDRQLDRVFQADERAQQDVINGRELKFGVSRSISPPQEHCGRAPHEIHPGGLPTGCTEGRHEAQDPVAIHRLSTYWRDLSAHKVANEGVVAGVGSVRVGVLQPLVQSALGFGKGALDGHTEGSEAWGADGDEERGLRLDPSRQVRKPGSDEIGTGQLRAVRGHSRKLPALAGTRPAARRCARRATRGGPRPPTPCEIGSSALTRLNVTGRWREPPDAGKGAGWG